MVQEYISDRRIRRELTSPRFIAGLKKIVHLTQTRGREASFVVQKFVGHRPLIYDQIELGLEDSIGPDSQRVLRERYEAEHGKLPSPLDEDFVQRIIAYKAWQEQQQQETTVVYPISTGLDLRSSALNINDLLKTKRGRSYDLDDLYTVIDVHTHPLNEESLADNDQLRPSLQDLRHLNQSRKKIGDDYVSPIEAVVVVPMQQRATMVSLLMFQEETISPLGEQALQEAYNLFPNAKLGFSIPEYESRLQQLPYNVAIAGLDLERDRVRIRARKGTFQIGSR